MQLKLALIISTVLIILLLAVKFINSMMDDGLKVSQGEDSNVSALLDSENIEFAFISEEKTKEVLFLDKPIRKYDQLTIWWEELATSTVINEFEDKYGISVPEVNLDSGSIFISVGRKIAKLRGDSESNLYPGHTIAIVTFYQEYYENTVFFYSIERNDPSFVPSNLISPCFIMEGEEEKYLGLSLYFLSE